MYNYKKRFEKNINLNLKSNYLEHSEYDWKDVLNETSKHISEKNERLEYDLLPAEYDIKKIIKGNMPSISNENQKQMFYCIINNIESEFRNLYYQNYIKHIPKINVYTDEDDAIILSWAYSIYRIYFDIEKNIQDSFYGMIIKASEKNIQTKTDVLTKENCANIVEEALQYILRYAV